MNRLLSLMMAGAALFLSSCANDLTPEEADRGPAPYSPDPTVHVPSYRDPAPLGNPGGY